MQKQKKPFYKKWWFWVIIVIVVIAVIPSGNSDTKQITTEINIEDTANVEFDESDVLEDDLVEEIITEVENTDNLLNSSDEIIDVVVIEDPEPLEKIYVSDGHTWYMSTHYSARFYYCDTDLGWEGLSEKYLVSFFSEKELLNQYPSQILHEPCS